VQEDGAVHEFGAPCAELPAPIEVSVHDPAFWPAVALGGSMGASDSYVRGEWRTSDLTGLLRLVSQNEAVFYAFDAGLPRASEWLRRLGHACAATRGSAAAATSARTTTWATTSSPCSSIRP
jgi:cyclopropane-fatty-acyl-phospholipid synthase